MKLKLFTLSIMILSSLFSCSQKSKYDTVKKDVLFYEFNNQRDEIYILDKEKKLSVYNVDNKTSTEIAAFSDKKFEEKWFRQPLYYTESNNLYVVGSEYVYKIFNKEIIEKIPISTVETITSWEISEGTYYPKKEKFNKFLSGF